MAGWLVEVIRVPFSASLSLLSYEEPVPLFMRNGRSKRSGPEGVGKKRTTTAKFPPSERTRNTQKFELRVDLRGRCVRVRNSWGDTFLCRQEPWEWKRRDSPFRNVLFVIPLLPT